MTSLNRATLIGNLGRDPEIRTTSSGDRIANLSLATSETWRDKSTGEKKERTEWHRVVVFGPLVNVIEAHVRKGSKLFIEGQIQTRKWQAQDGTDRYSTEIVLSGYNGRMLMLDGRGRPAPADDAGDWQGDQPADDSEMPF